MELLPLYPNTTVAYVVAFYEKHIKYSVLGVYHKKVAILVIYGIIKRCYPLIKHTILSRGIRPYISGNVIKICPVVSHDSCEF